MGFTPFVTEARSLLYLRSREVLLHALLHGAGFPLFPLMLHVGGGLALKPQQVLQVQRKDGWFDEKGRIYIIFTWNLHWGKTPCFCWKFGLVLVGWPLRWMEVGDIMWKLHRTSAPKARLYSIFLHIGWCVWVKAFFMVLSLRKTWRSLGNWVHQLDPIGSIEKLYFYDYNLIVCFTVWVCHKKICQVPWRIGICSKYFYGRMTLGWFPKCAKFLVGNFWKNASASCLSMFSRRMHFDSLTYTYIHLYQYIRTYFTDFR